MLRQTSRKLPMHKAPDDLPRGYPSNITAFLLKPEKKREYPAYEQQANSGEVPQEEKEY